MIHYKAGAQVRCAHGGRGTVVASDGASVTVAFKRHVRTVLASDVIETIEPYATSRTYYPLGTWKMPGGYGAATDAAARGDAVAGTGVPKVK